MSGLAATARTWGEMIKFSHSVFALPFALLATFLAARPARPTPLQLLLVLVCMVAARSAAMTFNRLVDRRYDALNPRTANRALPAGRISARAAWGFFAAAAILFHLGAAGFWWLSGNRWPLLLAPLVLAWLCFYSYTKRFTAWSHFLLGAALGVAPLAAWIAVAPHTLGWPTLWLVLAVVTWVGGFDIIYACQDTEFDRAHGLHSLPARLGVAPALWLAHAAHVAAVCALIAVGLTAQLGILYFVGVGCGAALLLIENMLVRPHDLSRVNLAFFTINGIVGLVLGLLGIADVLLT